MLTNIQSTPQEACRVSVLDIKSILSLLSDEISMRTLTVAIRQHCLQAHQTHFKDYFLRFFLKCECKLKKSTNAQWNRVINNQLKKIVGIQNICQFMSKKLLSSGLTKMQRLPFLDEPTIEEQINEEFGELRDMDISEDVKIKTKYFFKWFQFLEDKRELKRMKTRQIQNLRAAKQFNHQSLKFQNFNRWKQYVSRIRLTKQRGLVIEQKTKTKQLVSIFSEIKEKIEIISIEKMLEEAVYKKLESLQVKQFFQKFRFARQRATNISAALRLKDNIWLYRFYSFLIKDSLPLMNKTSVLARRDRELNFQRICVLNSWKGLKSLVKKTDEKVSRVKQLLRNVNIKSFFQIKRLMREQRLKKQQTKLFVKKSQFITLLSMVKQQQLKEACFKEREASIEKYVITGSVKWLFRQLARLRGARRDIKNKLTTFHTIQSHTNQRYFFSNLKGFNSKKLQIFQFSRKVQSAYLIKAFQSGMRSYRQWRQNCKQLNNDMLQRYSIKLLGKGWKGLKQTKKIKAGEFEAFSCLTQILETRILTDAFIFLKDRHQRSNQIENLLNRTELIVKKVAFITILNRMLSKKMKAKSFAAKQQLKLKRKLFDWLLANKVHMASSTAQARLIYSRVMKRQLLYRLREELQVKEALDKADYSLQLRSKTRVLQKMKGCLLKSKQYESSSEVVSLSFKKRRFLEMASTIKYLVVFREQEDQRSLKVAKKAVRNYLKTFRSNVKKNKNRRQVEVESVAYYQQRVNKVRMAIKSSVLKTMLRQSETALIKKSTQLRQNNLLGILKMLNLNTASSRLRKMVRQSNASEIIQCMRQNTGMKVRRQLLVEKLNKNWLSYSLRNIQENLQAQKLQLDQKIEEVREAIHLGRVRRCKQILISRLKGYFELKENAMILLNIRARQSCKEMVRLHLKHKSKAIKQFVALRHYATNVKRRAMRALKCTISLSVLKENKNKTENNSKIIMEKSIDNFKKKSKLIETIERYNLSRVSRVIR